MSRKVKKILCGTPHILSFIRSFASGAQWGMSLNITNRCNFHCTHCYWEEGQFQMSDDAVSEFLRSQSEQGKLLCTVIGGEPYLRRKLLVRITEENYIPAFWVVTNGWQRFEKLPHTTHFVSVDGVGELHDRIRNQPGSFEKLKMNLREVRSGYFPAFIHSTLNALNFTQVESILDHFVNLGLVDGIMFSLHTPTREGMLPIVQSGRGENIAKLTLNVEDRAFLVEKMLRLKRVYGSFLAMTPLMIERLHPEHTVKQVPATCGTSNFVASFDERGEKIAQCIFGPNGDCSNCGCVVTPTIESLAQGVRGLSTIPLLARLYTP